MRCARCGAGGVMDHDTWVGLALAGLFLVGLYLLWSG